MEKTTNLELIESYLISVAVEIESDSDAQKLIIEKLMKSIETECGIIYNEQRVEYNLIKYKHLLHMYRSCFDHYDHPIGCKIILQNKKYKNSFNKIEKLGYGSFGSVFKVRGIKDKQLYAIKKIKLSDVRYDEIERKFNESQIWAKLKNEFCVEYKASWIERHETLNIPVIHIQTELCSINLMDAMKKIQTELNYNKDNINSRGLFIASQLFDEICSGVKYLHSLNPPIIHRDLKPENILFTDGKNGNFLKICDFGLATGHAKRDDFIDELFNIKLSHSAGCGTRKYMAPEVVKGRDYDTSADLYSIGVIMGELFCIDTEVFNNEKRLISPYGINEIRKYVIKANLKYYLNEYIIKVIIKYLYLIHPEQLERVDMFQKLDSRELIPFEDIMHNEDMFGCYYKLFASKQNSNSLSNSILRVKINKYLEKESNVKEKNSFEAHNDVNIMKEIRNGSACENCCTNIMDLKLIERINKLIFCYLYTHVEFSQMKVFLEENLFKLTLKKWIIEHHAYLSTINKNFFYYFVRNKGNCIILITDKDGIECNQELSIRKIVFNDIKYENFTSNLIDCALKALQTFNDVEQTKQMIENELNEKYYNVLNGKKFLCLLSKNTVIVEDNFNYGCDHSLLHLNDHSIYVSMIDYKIEKMQFSIKWELICSQISAQEKEVIQYFIDDLSQFLCHTLYYKRRKIVFTHTPNNNSSTNNEKRVCLLELICNDDETDFNMHVYKHKTRHDYYELKIYYL